MLVVGLTGGIATGKSTVSSLLKAHTITVIDADVIARQVVQPGTKAHAEIVKQFGEEILLADGTLDRPKLGAVIFGDEGKRKQLNSIVHPAVRMEMVRQVFWSWMKGKRYCVIDVPLLIETGLYQWVGLTVVVSCSEQIQLSRLMQRDNMPEEAARARVKSQMPISAKADYADIVIDNTDSLDELRSRVDDLILRLEMKTRWMWFVEWLVPPVGIASAVLTLIMRRCMNECRKYKENRKQK
ncbi:CAB5 [Sanghuangporus weigelae]